MADPNMTNRYVATKLQNDLWLVSDRASGLRGCYEANGNYRHGDLRLDGYLVLDNPFNRANGYQSSIGRLVANPPSYANVLKLNLDRKDG